MNLGFSFGVAGDPQAGNFHMPWVKQKKKKVNLKNCTDKRGCLGFWLVQCNKWCGHPLRQSTMEAEELRAGKSVLNLITFMCLHASHVVKPGRQLSIQVWI